MPDRRTVIAGLGVGALAAGVDAARAGEVTIRGEADYAQGKMPEGYLKIRLDDLSVKEKAQRRIAEVHIRVREGDGAVPFELKAPRARLDKATKLELVGRLERADGWLLARGTAPYNPGRSADLILNPVIY